MDEPQISEVLKSLNHSTRRDILLFLADRDKETGFSELMDVLDFTNSSSGQFSYHLKLLINSNLLQKTSDNKYTVTELGRRANALMSMVNTQENETVGQKIMFSFRNLTPFDQVILGCLGLVLGLFGLSAQILFETPNTSEFTIFFSFLLLFSSIILILILYYSYKKLNYIPSIIVLTSIIWVILLPENQIKVGWIYLGSILGSLFTIQAIVDNIKNNVDTSFQLLSGIIIIISVLIVAGMIIYEEFKSSNKII